MSLIIPGPRLSPLSLTAVLLLQCVSNSLACDRLIERSWIPESQKTGYYIVSLKDDTTPEAFQRIADQAESLSVDGKFMDVFR